MRTLFPPWTNKLRALLAAGVIGGAVYLVTVVTLGFSPKATDVGYRPKQPVPFSHALHAGDLGLDCRYCHNTVERAAHAAVPATETCMACHARIHDESRKLAPVRESWATGKPVPWKKVHDLPDYAYFDHSAHVLAGVGCVSCHGRIDQMEVVHQDEPLSMGWCLDCHRDPTPHLRPPELVTAMEPLDPRDPRVEAARVAAGDRASEDCSTCHR
ncbi:MAG: cytochrome c3 family protein [Myxococcales bacterium]|nr:cytochrome c3 family protein [Myxococcales bacterium]